MLIIPMNRDHNVLILGNFMWEIESRKLLRIDNGICKSSCESISLTHRQDQLLQCLLSAHPETLSRQQIIEKIWGSQHISQESLPQLINRTRQTLEDTSKRIIINKVGVGYKLKFNKIEGSNVTMDNKDKLSLKKRKLDRYWLIIVVGLGILTLLNIWHFAAAIGYKLEFEKVLQAKKYPYITPIDSEKSTVIIDNHECIYDRTQLLLTCQ
ncbi:TPA: helix-turn-helix domain-containing protein [Vibrio vulnificus]|nr:helix-turn-helix domain-containing protein [Vibrio vulnificus]HAS6035130.1 helix-turn-helix domain-containing protein [Vibrio vulnificus]